MISVIIPTLNEENQIETLLSELGNRSTGLVDQVIVVDGGSSDDTRGMARRTGAQVVRSPRKGRAAQMNIGAEQARGEILYFLHADSLPPDGFDRKIVDAVDLGFDAGCFRLKFDDDHPLLRFYAWFTKFDINAFRFGDQSLFITHRLFKKIDGFLDRLVLMEDNEIIGRIKRETPFRIIPEPVTTSSRKYKDIGVLKLQLIFTLIYVLFHLGIPQEKLVDFYENFIDA